MQVISHLHNLFCYTIKSATAGAAAQKTQTPIVAKHNLNVGKNNPL